MIDLAQKHKGITFGIIAVCLLAVGWYLYSSSQPLVVAQGSSSIEARPDIISVYFVIETRNINQATSQLENTKIHEALLRQLSLVGFTEDQISFSGFSTYPEYDWSSDERTLLGYVTREDVILKLSNFEDVSRAVSSGILAGAYVSTINFELSDELQSEYKTQALELASADAREKAKAQARGLGKSLGALVAVESSDFNYYPYPYYTKSGSGAVAEDNAAASEAAIRIAPQDVEINAYVSVTYRLR